MDNLPIKIKQWLNDRQISDEVLTLRKIKFDGRIVIPVMDEKGNTLFNKYRRDPNSDEGPKYTYDKGAHSALYCLDNLSKSNEIVICEGELDCLALESKGINAVTSTGGAGTFKEEWKSLLDGKEVFVCFDNDKAGEEGIIRVCRLIPHAKVIPLPPEIGDHGDVTDFFVKLGKSAKDFRLLMSVAEPLSIPPEPTEEKPRRKKRPGDGADLSEAKKVPLEEFLKFNRQGFAKCPLHGTDTTPSLKKYPDNRWYCYGCGVGGDVVDLIMKRDGLTLPEAVKQILKN